MKKAIGIDLGTTNSAIAFKDTEVKILRSKENEELVRSCVSLIKDEIFIGKTAYITGLKRNPENTILSVKRLMGGAIKDKMIQKMISNKKKYRYGITELKGGTEDSVAIILGGKQYTPEQISALILKKLKKDAEEKLGDEVTHAVVTVPAYFTEKQKNATRIAAQIAGLKVQKLLAEPTAAAIAYGVDNLKTGDSTTVLIYDFGGGTFDLSILNIVDGQYMEAGTGGDRWLGGDDIDKKLQEFIIDKVEKEYNVSNLEGLIEKLPKKKRDLFESEIISQTEEAKKQLSSAKSTGIYIDNILEDENGDLIDIDVEIKRDEFEKIIKPFIQKSIDLIEELFLDVGYDISMIDNILLIGGTSCIPLVKEMLSEKYGSDRIRISEKPMLAVAEGAGILSHRLGDEYETPLEITNTVDEISCSTNHNYFIEYQTKDGSVDYRKIIEKQFPLPISKSEIFKTTVNNQKIARISLFTDVEGNAKELMTSSYFTIDVDLPIQYEIVFNIELDTNENFKIQAYPKGQKSHIKDIIIGRGDKDSKAYKTIQEYTNEVLTGVISWRAKDKYFEKLKEMIILSELIGDNPSDIRWAEIDFKIKNAYDEALRDDKIEKEGNKDENILLWGLILVKEYGSIIFPSDLKDLVEFLKLYEDSNSFEKTELISRINSILDKYTTLIALYRLKDAAEEALNGHGSGALGETNAIQDSEYLRSQHDRILSYFQTGQHDEGYAVLYESYVVAKKYL
jgi:molecular chaperone DnaK